MTIQDEIWLLAHSKEPEDRREWAVLYFKSQGLTHRQIAEKLGYGKDWVQRYMTSAYRRFGAPKDVDKDEKFEWLEKNVFPALKEFIAGNPDTLKELPPPPQEDSTLDTPEPGGDPVEAEIINVEPQIVTIRNNRPFPVVRAAVAGVSMIAVCGVCAALLLIAYLFRNNFIPAIPAPTLAITATLPLIELTTMPIEVPTITSPPNTAAPLDTPLPPTETVSVKDFYNQGEWAPLRDSVYVRMSTDFETASSGTCAPPNPGFAVTLEIHNTGDQFLIRFDPSAFEAQDDLGNQYTLEGAGINVCDAVGPHAYPATSYEYLRLKFSGQVPLNAQYLIITADSLSGVRVVFHKQY